MDFHCKPFDWLIDWRQVNFDLIGLLDSYRTICFYGGGAKVIEHRGTIQYSSVTQTTAVFVLHNRFRPFALIGGGGGNGVRILSSSITSIKYTGCLWSFHFSSTFFYFKFLNSFDFPFSSSRKSSVFRIFFAFPAWISFRNLFLRAIKSRWVMFNARDVCMWKSFTRIFTSVLPFMIYSSFFSHATLITAGHFFLSASTVPPTIRR